MRGFGRSKGTVNTDRVRSQGPDNSEEPGRRPRTQKPHHRIQVLCGNTTIPQRPIWRRAIESEQFEHRKLRICELLPVAPKAPHRMEPGRLLVLRVLLPSPPPPPASKPPSGTTGSICYWVQYATKQPVCPHGTVFCRLCSRSPSPPIN